MSELNENFPGRLGGRVMAIASGKGGSGKTMIVAAIAEIASSHSSIDEIVLIDADFGTAGLSYYLGLHHVRNIRHGLTDLLLAAKIKSDDVPPRLQKIDGIPRSRFLPIGDFRRLLYPHWGDAADSDQESRGLLGSLATIIDALRAPHRFIIVDCRGGVDDELGAVCRVVDEIMLVAEPDTTSFQATRHVADALGDLRLGHKINGFVLNKVLEDPSSLRRSASSAFAAQYLGSIPFDLEATRAFLVGDLPPRDSVFMTHVQDALSRSFPDDIESPKGRIWQSADYANLSLRSPGEALAGLILSVLILIFGTLTVIELYAENTTWPKAAILAAGLTLVSALSNTEPARRLLGAFLNQWRSRRPSSSRYLR